MGREDIKVGLTDPDPLPLEKTLDVLGLVPAKADTAITEQEMVPGSREDLRRIASLEIPEVLDAQDLDEWIDCNGVRIGFDAAFDVRSWITYGMDVNTSNHFFKG